MRQAKCIPTEILTVLEKIQNLRSPFIGNSGIKGNSALLNNRIQKDMKGNSAAFQEVNIFSTLDIAALENVHFIIIKIIINGTYWAPYDGHSLKVLHTSLKNYIQNIIKSRAYTKILNTDISKYKNILCWKHVTMKTKVIRKTKMVLKTCDTNRKWKR